MSDRQFGAWIGTPMRERDVEALLAETGWGILSLADDGDAYAIPVSFGFDDETAYLVFLEMDPPHRKTQFAETTAQACLTVSAVNGRFDWDNVLLRGKLRPVESDSEEFETLLDVMADNAWFSRTYTRSAGLDNVEGFALDVEERTGRQKHEDR